MKIIKLSFLSILLTLNGCIGGAYDKKIDNGYVLNALDSMNDLSLMYIDSELMINVVSARIIAYYSGKNCIVVERINLSESEFYIVPFESRRVHDHYSKNLAGPFDRNSSEKAIKRYCGEMISMTEL